MSILSTLYQGVSGLNTNNTRMEVVGNNIANVNTIGFKAGRVHFEELLGRTLLGSSVPSKVGGGAKVGATEQVFLQGSFAATGVATDMAISGEGFFMVNGDDGQNYFTRAGQFRLDDQGFVTSPNGMRLQGFTAGSNGDVGSKLGDLQISRQPLPPQATTSIDLRIGLTGTTEARDPNEQFSLTDPGSTSDFSTTTTVVDSQGNSHQVNVHYRKTADGEWSWHAVADSDALENGADTPFTEIGSGTLSFDENGNLANETGGALSATFSGAAAQSITLDFGESISEGGDGSGASNQFSETGNTNIDIDTDGRTSGVLQGIRVADDGTIFGSYSNGEELAVGRVALAVFNSPTGLDNAGNNLFRANGLSGEPIIGEPGTGGAGGIVSAALEQSNVDLAAEFVNMITAQRGYQANARTITTADEIYAETVQLKR